MEPMFWSAWLLGANTVTSRVRSMVSEREVAVTAPSAEVRLNCGAEKEKSTGRMKTVSTIWSIPLLKARSYRFGQ